MNTACLCQDKGELRIMLKCHNCGSDLFYVNETPKGSLVLICAKCDWLNDPCV